MTIPDEAVQAMPERIFLGCADADNEHQVWTDEGEGGTEYYRADLALPFLTGVKSPRAQALEELENYADEKTAIAFSRMMEAKRVNDTDFADAMEKERNAYSDMTKRIRALSSQPVADGWLPIETAPKDGTPVILAVPTEDKGRFIVGEAYFDPENYEGGDWWWAGTAHTDHFDSPISEINHNAPTHWRHLPASPGASE